MTAPALQSAADYQRRAILNRPTDAVALAGEIRRLASTGLTARDISAALRVALPVVFDALVTDGAE